MLKPGIFRASRDALTRLATAVAPFLQARGYRMASDEVLWQRLVHLVDEAKRNELMIIYLEDLSGMGLTAADLAKAAPRLLAGTKSRKDYSTAQLRE